MLKEIGQGGMSRVYLVEHEGSGSIYAVKEMKRNVSGAEGIILQSLLAEKEILKRYHHPGIVPIVDAVTQDRYIYLVMEFIEGETLDTSHPDSGEEVLHMAMEICEILAYLHSRRPEVIYQDLKPSNLMRRKDGRVVLIDFGAAKELIDSGSKILCLGTKGYAAPEQYRGEPAGASTDIYAFGKTIQELMTGIKPWECKGSNREKITFKEICSLNHVEKPLDGYKGEDLHMMEGLWKILQICCRENAAERYQSCTDLYLDLQKVAEGKNIYGLTPRIYQKRSYGKEYLALQHMMDNYGNFGKCVQEGRKAYGSWEQILIPMEETSELYFDTEDASTLYVKDRGIRLLKDICIVHDRV